MKIYVVSLKQGDVYDPSIQVVASFQTEQGARDFIKRLEDVVKIVLNEEWSDDSSVIRSKENELHKKLTAIHPKASMEYAYPLYYIDYSYVECDLF